MMRKLRGILGFGATWSMAWGAVFAAIGVIVGLFDPDSIDPGEGPLGVGLIGAMFGLVSGATFAVVLSLAERRRVLRDLSMWRAAVWGILGTALFPLVTPVHNSMLIFLCPIGAALAAGSVVLAKRAELGAPNGQPTLPRTEP